MRGGAVRLASSRTARRDGLRGRLRASPAGQEKGKKEECAQRGTWGRSQRGLGQRTGRRGGRMDGAVSLRLASGREGPTRDTSRHDGGREPAMAEREARRGRSGELLGGFVGIAEAGGGAVECGTPCKSAWGGEASQQQRHVAIGSEMAGEHCMTGERAASRRLLREWTALAAGEGSQPPRPPTAGQPTPLLFILLVHTCSPPYGNGGCGCCFLCSAFPASPGLQSPSPWPFPAAAAAAAAFTRRPRWRSRRH